MDAQELLRRVLSLFADAVEKDKALTTLWERIHGEGASYADAQEFACIAGEKLSDALREVSGEIPEHMEQAFADVLLRGALKGDYDLVSEAAVAVQQALNEQAGLGLKAQPAPLNTGRIDGLVNKFAGYENLEDALWLLGEPIVNFSQSIVDDTLKANVDFQGKAGLRPRIIRKMAGGGCKWCRSLAGTYDYPNVPRDVYRRHQRCRCTVEYDPGNGSLKRQDVWSKRWTDPKERAKIEARKQIGVGVASQPPLSPEQLVVSVSQCEVADSKIVDYLLKPGAKHSDDFFSVGYSQENPNQLLADIRKSFENGVRVEAERIEKSGDIRFNIYAMLGIKEKKRFCIGWQIDSGTQTARLITAFRKDRK